MTLKRILSLLTAFVLLLCSGVAIAEEEEPIIYDVTDYISSISNLDLTPYKGKIIVLFFYTSAGEQSTATLPMWKLIHDDFDPDDVEIVLVHAWDGEGQEESNQLKERFQLEGMNIYEDENSTLCKTLGLVEYPNTLILNAEGTPASGYSGQLSYTTTAEYLIGLGATQLQNTYVFPDK